MPGNGWFVDICNSDGADLEIAGHALLRCRHEH
jgi:hypothetical protein